MEKRGLTDALRSKGISDPTGIYWSDEMRVGLIGQVRRVWASVGVKVVQPLEFVYKWSYLNLAVNGLTGQLLWQWGKNMKAETIAPIVTAWAEDGVKALVWDRARGHRGEAYADCSVVRIEQPPYAPELNPPERIFEYLRSKVEGTVYGTIERKKAAIEAQLTCLARDPDAVKRLAGWHWIQSALHDLAPSPVS